MVHHLLCEKADLNAVLGMIMRERAAKHDENSQKLKAATPKIKKKKAD